MALFLEKVRNSNFFSKTYTFIILAFAFSLPLFPILLPKFIFAWLFLWLLEGEFKYKLSVLKSNKIFFFIFTGFYIYHLAGGLYSENIPSFLFDAEVKASFFIFPFLILSPKFKDKIFTHTILKFFIYGILTAIAFCLLRASYRTIIMDEATFIKLSNLGNPIQHIFTYTELSYFLHPGYFSAYILFSLLILFYFKTEHFHVYIVKKNYLFYSIFLLFIVFIFLLSSKAGLIAFVITFLIVGFVHILKLKKLWYFIPMGIIVFVFIYLMANYNYRVKFLITEIKRQTKEIRSGNNEDLITGIKNANDRVTIWINSIDIVRENFIFGVGSGDIKDELLKMYKTHKMDDAYATKLNVHNQYIETLIGQGIIGLLWLLSILLLPLIISIKEKKIFFTGFIIIAGINLFFESMFNTQAGVIFFGFFYSLFFLTHTKESAV
jgi:O-antigen ligase